MIEVINLAYKNVLENINMKFDREFNFIYGENGAGKSTLLDCISNLNKEFTGTIMGNDNIVYLNQYLYFSPKLTFRDFVMFIFFLEGIKGYKNTFFEYADKYGLVKEFEENWGKRVGMLSGGERRKLFFSTICCLDRTWYMFDEPFAGVDIKGKDYMVRQFNDFIDNNKGIIITSHETEPLNGVKSVKKHVLDPPSYKREQISF